MNQPKDKLFESNFDKPLFKIEITINENCSNIQIVPVDNYKPTYHEVIGAIESTRHHMMNAQTKHNQKQAKKQKITK